tara:strand:+ start:187 stop:1320 length:1134 start_codon:yes stop_codon:yes gene_type:complete
MNYLQEINKIKNSTSFTDLCELAKKNNYLRHIHERAFSYLDLHKIKNFLIACTEEKYLKIRLKSKPYRVIIEPTNACNLGCQLCPTGLNASNRKKGIMKFVDFKKIIDEVKEYCIEIHLYNWGEPTLNKDLIEMLRYAKKNNLWTRISTNLSLNYKKTYLKDLITSGLSLIHVDVDGLNQEIYSKYRLKGDLELVKKNLNEIKSIKNELATKEPVLELAMLAMRQNEHQHKDFKKFADYYNADVVRIDKIQINPNMDKKWLPKNKNLIYKTYEGGKAPSRAAQENEYKQCHWPWSGIVINWDGNLNPCCIIDDPSSDFGNVKKTKIKNIWNSDEYISSRAEFSNRKKIRKNVICNVCKNQTHSKNLNRVSNTFAIKM